MKNLISRNLKNLVSQIAELAQYLWERGWAERNAGNISLNISDLIRVGKCKRNKSEYFKLPKTYPELGGNYFFVSGTGTRMRDLAKKPYENSVIVKMNPQGDSYCLISLNKNSSENILPTSELPTHLGIHQMIAQRGSNEKVVLHTHASELIALTQHPELKTSAQINRILWGMHPETIIFIPKGIGFVAYQLPGSQEIADSTIDQLKKHQIVLWEKHGVFAIGSSILDTFDQIDIACKSAKTWLICKSAGFEPEGLNNKQLDELKALARKFAT